MDKIEKIKEWVKKQKKETLARNSIGVITGQAFFVDANELLSFLDTLSEEPDNDDLNDEIKKFIEEYGYERGGDKLLIAIVARHFAEWRKQQMLKEAMEGKIAERIQGKLYARCQIPKTMGVEFGDKVRIVVLKEEEE